MSAFSSRGMMLVTVMLLLSLVAVMIVTTLSHLGDEWLVLRHYSEAMRALQAAEAGVHEGLRRLPWLGHGEQHSQLSYQVHSQLLTTDSCQRRYIQILSTGFYRSTQVRLRVIKVDEAQLLDVPACHTAISLGSWQQLI